MTRLNAVYDSTHRIEQLGGHLKHILPALAVAASLFLTGCGAAESERPDAPTETTAPATAVQEDPVALVCDHLAGKHLVKDRPLADIVRFKHDALGEGYNNLDLSYGIIYMNEAIPAANAEMQPLLEDLKEPLQKIEDGETRVRWENFDAAAQELSEVCGIDLPTAYPTSGSYENDLVEAGVEVDDADAYGEFMAEKFCYNKIGDARGEFNYEVEQVGSGTGVDGTGPEAVMLTVSYFCPDRVYIAQDALESFGYL
jgi:hypothetical protein